MKYTLVTIVYNSTPTYSLYYDETLHTSIIQKIKKKKIYKISVYNITLRVLSHVIFIRGSCI